MFLWSDVSPRRDRGLIRRLVGQVRATVGKVQPVLLAVDHLAAYPKAVLTTFCTKQYTGKADLSRHLIWPDSHIVQVVKQRRGKRLKAVSRRVYHGCRNRVEELIAIPQTAFALINAAYLERLTATFRGRMPALVRRTRSPGSSCRAGACRPPGDSGASAPGCWARSWSGAPGVVDEPLRPGEQFHRRVAAGQVARGHLEWLERDRTPLEAQGRRLGVEQRTELGGSR
jgi:hypothetical protein